MAATSTTAPVALRSAGIDLLRVAGITAVVIGHVRSDDVTRAAVYTWHVPVFFLLTGYLWKPGRPLRVEWQRRWPTLGVPYLTWFLLLIAMLLAADAVTGRVASGTFADAIYGGSAAMRPFSAFWFVSVLFLLAVAYRLLERLPVAVAWGIALVGLVVAYVSPEAVTAGPLGVFLVPACLVFVLAGRLLRQVRPRLSAGSGVLLLVLGAALVVSGLSTPLDMKAGDFGRPGLGVLTAVLISAGLILSAEALDGRLRQRASAVIGALSACGIAVVLSHAAVLWVLGTPAQGGLFDFAAALLLPWGFALLALRTPFAPYLAGAPRMRRR
ncbi:acyltransferase [Micromonospora avicenniae]|uniref:acyltransferase n=1 Tax=Micromonospora avicenniae TaxID=1198245 RepID=UPI003318CD27